MSESSLTQPPAPEISPARLAANRANAQLSTGPKSEAGKAIVSLNAVKTGLTGCTVLLPADDAAQYQAHILSYQKELQPVGPEESALVQSIADIRWRLNRIPALEQSLLVLCHQDASETDPLCQNMQRTPMVEMTVRRLYAKEFHNLALQESRLSRRREKEMAELQKRQQERKEREAQAIYEAAKSFVLVQHLKQPFDPAAYGFEFSKEQLVRYLSRLDTFELGSLCQAAEREEKLARDWAA
jgi:hypothetical protein